MTELRQNFEKYQGITKRNPDYEGKSRLKREIQIVEESSLHRGILVKDPFYKRGCFPDKIIIFDVHHGILANGCKTKLIKIISDSYAMKIA